MGILEINLFVYWIFIFTTINYHNKKNESIFKNFIILVSTIIVSMTLDFNNLLFSALWAIITFFSIQFVDNKKMENLLIAIGASLSSYLIIKMTALGDLLIALLFFKVFSILINQQYTKCTKISSVKIASTIILVLFSSLFIWANSLNHVSAQYFQVVILIVLICYFMNIPIIEERKKGRLVALLIDHVVFALILPYKFINIIFDITINNYNFLNNSINILILLFVMVNSIFFFYNNQKATTLTGLRSVLYSNNLFIFIYGRMYNVEIFSYYLILSILILFVFERFYQKKYFDKIAVGIILLIALPVGPVVAQKLILANSFNMFYSAAILLAVYPLRFLLRPQNA